MKFCNKLANYEHFDLGGKTENFKSFYQFLQFYRIKSIDNLISKDLKAITKPLKLYEIKSQSMYIPILKVS
ncbi:hypothetical protein COC46_18435 [Bacillus sp. AFS041924]|nr:hypothetical protein COC46_18435 [Bacillus sp. AFS041924]